MTKLRTIQILRGTTAQNNAYTGVIGELTMDTEKKQLRIHDGSTVGGKVVGGDGITNQNTATGATNPIYDWVGTLAEYNAQNIETQHPDWVCYITDDLGLPATEVGQITEDVNELNAHKVVEFQAPTAENGYTWYRKYADGWVEQGGKQVTPANANNWATTTITLPAVMANTNYNVYVANCNLTNGSFGSGGAAVTTDRTTTSFVYSQYNVNGGSDTPLEWEVKGMAA